MKELLRKFILEGNVYRGNKYDFLLLKDFIEFARKENLNIKIRDLQQVLIEDGWKRKKASISTTEGYQSKDIWYLVIDRVTTWRELPVLAVPRKNLIEAENLEADRLVNDIFTLNKSANELPKQIVLTKEVLIFTNKGLKELLVMLQAKGDLSKLSAIIRNKSDKMLVGEHFFGTSSRTVLFKNYYRLKNSNSITEEEKCEKI